MEIKVSIQRVLMVSIMTLLISYVGEAKNKKLARPNIVIIYADDMGYGDLASQNPESKIPTPNLDKLASAGMRFTDAYSSSGICSPSRFAMLIGQYHWRRTHNIVQAFGLPLFKDSDITLPQVLKDDGYTTACVTKWHLGWEWDFVNEEPSGERTFWGRTRPTYLAEDVKLNQPFFLYMALPSPHEPVIPDKEFLGKSEAGAYGDFMYQSDWMAGLVLEALKENGCISTIIQERSQRCQRPLRN